MADDAQNTAPNIAPDEAHDVVTSEEAPDEAAGNLPDEADGTQSGEEGPLLEPCATCATPLDVTGQEPFAQVCCPECNNTMRVRTRIKNFSLVEVLGAGGMGAVYKARDEYLNRMIALKVVRNEYSADPLYLAKFEREARITAAVNHPHVVKVFSFGSEHGLYYIAMELVDKGSLDELMSLQGRVAEVQVLDIGIQVAEGLRAAHQAGLIHRDIKPGNILFADARTAKMVDFGLALLAAHEAEERGEIWGTPYYVAPEKLEHLPEDFRSDIYSLGATLFHAMAGRPPYEAETASMVALKHLKSRPVSLQAFAPDVSSATAYVINRMLNKDPEQRYQSYDELIEHLQYAKTHIGDEIGKLRGPKQRVVVHSERHQKFAGLVNLILVGIVIALGAAAFVFRDKLFKSSAPKTPSAAANAASQNAPDANTEKYEAARKQILDGDVTGAQDAFKKLATQGISQPLQNWATLHEGIAALLGGRLADARAAFQTLQTRAAFSNDAANKPLADFFVETARLASDEQPLTADAAQNFNRPDFGALALFVFALKDWELGKFSEANELFQAFLSTDPREPWTWIADYKAIAQKYAAAFASYKKITDALGAASTTSQRNDLLNQIAQLKPQTQGKLVERLDQIAADLKKQNATVTDAETKLVNDARARFNALCASYQFAEARAVIQSVSVTEAAPTERRAALLKKADWLQRFKTTLVSDLNAAGYPETLRKKDGAVIPGAVKKASDTQFEVQSQYGSVAVPWAEVAPASILAMANYFTARAGAFPDYAADRTWWSGVFAFQLGLQKESRELLTKAAQMKSQYQAELSLFFNVAGEAQAP